MAKVIFAGSAEHDLLDIEYYIFTNLKNPQAVRRISDGILDFPFYSIYVYAQIENLEYVF